MLPPFLSLLVFLLAVIQGIHGRGDGENCYVTNSMVVFFIFSFSVTTTDIQSITWLIRITQQSTLTSNPRLQMMCRLPRFLTRHGSSAVSPRASDSRTGPPSSSGSRLRWLLPGRPAAYNSKVSVQIQGRSCLLPASPPIAVTARMLYWQNLGDQDYSENSAFFLWSIFYEARVFLYYFLYCQVQYE